MLSFIKFFQNKAFPANIFLNKFCNQLVFVQNKELDNALKIIEYSFSDLLRMNNSKLIGSLNKSAGTFEKINILTFSFESQACINRFVKK